MISILINSGPDHALTKAQVLHVLKCHCNEKIFGPILNTTEQHF